LIWVNGPLADGRYDACVTAPPAAKKEKTMPSTLTTLVAAVLALGLLAAQPVDANGACADCHGTDGASTEADVPTIGGLSSTYLIDAMAAYRDNKRPCPESKYRGGDTQRPPTGMCKIAAQLGADGAAKAAKEYAAKPFVRAKQKFDPAKAATGKKIHDQACEKCHSEGGTLADDDAGILAGQSRLYLKQTLADLMSGKRPISEKMKVKTDALKPDDVEALLHYYASQQ
jgi:cytochrome subunit of sulfide dehydrogenase